MPEPEIIFWRDRKSGVPGRDPDDRQRYRYRVVAEGDSWFTINGASLTEPPWNLLMSLDFPDATILVNLAHPGDSMRSMSRLCNSSDLRYALTEQFGYRWDAILLSAGGNDLVDYASLSDNRGFLIPAGERGSVNGPEDYIYPERLQKVLDYVTGGYRIIRSLRDGPQSGCRNAPIFTHTYDRVVPRDAPASIGPIQLGPWLFRSFTEEQVPQADWMALSDHLLGRLRESITALATGLTNFHVVNTFGILTPADSGTTGDSNDWLNEIHPNRGGYRKLAQKVSDELQDALS